MLSVLAVVASGGAGEASSQEGGTSHHGQTSMRARDDMGEDIANAVSVVDRFWAAHWSDFFTGRYIRPKIYGGYSRYGRAAPYCGNTRAAYNNAEYCPYGDFIGWDLTFMRNGYLAGDAWVYLVVAHEWGHAIQYRLAPSLVWRARELQADCLAGAVLFGAAEDGTLQFEDGDVDELAAAFRRMGDRTPWTRVEDHGTAKQRLSAFTKGADGGVNACLP